MLVAIFIALAVSGDAPAELTVDELLAAVRDHAPALAAARASFGVVAADETGAGVWPNPSASYNFSATVAGADTLNGQQHALDIAQPILIAGQGGARVDAAHAATHAADADLHAAAADLERDARAAFDDLLVAQARVDIADKALAELATAEKVVDARAQTGSSSRYDALRIAAAVATQQAAVGDEEAKLLDAQARVATLLGQPGYAAHAVGDLKPEALPQERAFDATKLWSVAGAQRRIDAKQKALTRAEREAWPTPQLSVGTFAYTTSPGAAVLAGISSEIPLFDRNQSGIAHARAEVAEAEAQERQALLEGESAYRAARTAAERASAVLAQFDGRTGGEQLNSLRGMAREGYESGKQSILELVDALAAIVAVELQRVDLVGNARRTRLDLARASGELGDLVLPRDPTPTGGGSADKGAT
ncbi:MAG TPA: TolC family protein [Myxococcota bacterium]|jgi:cobalt-zinc-cadmium efflux system outer membrane protein